jgi:hypothetical protein
MSQRIVLDERRTRIEAREDSRASTRWHYAQCVVAGNTPAEEDAGHGDRALRLVGSAWIRDLNQELNA